MFTDLTISINHLKVKRKGELCLSTNLNAYGIPWRGLGLINGTVYGHGDYQKIIQKRALDGWRYVGTIPAIQRATGHVEEMDLVFEKVENF